MAEYFTLVAVKGKKGITVARAPGWYKGDTDDGVIVEGNETEVQKIVATAYVSPDEGTMAILEALAGKKEFPRIVKTVREYPVEYKEDNADAEPF